MDSWDVALDSATDEADIQARKRGYTRVGTRVWQVLRNRIYYEVGVTVVQEGDKVSGRFRASTHDSKASHYKKVVGIFLRANDAFEALDRNLSAAIVPRIDKLKPSVAPNKNKDADGYTGAPRIPDEVNKLRDLSVGTITYDTSGGSTMVS